MLKCEREIIEYAMQFSRSSDMHCIASYAFVVIRLRGMCFGKVGREGNESLNGRRQDYASHCCLRVCVRTAGSTAHGSVLLLCVENFCETCSFAAYARSSIQLALGQ